jgi:hypothetical protein
MANFLSFSKNRLLSKVKKSLSGSIIGL